MFDPFDNEFGEVGFNVNPARQTLAACGYDPCCYISTAKLESSPYTTKLLIQAKLGGLIKLIEACDDSQPPIGDLTGDALITYQNIIQNVTTEINGLLSSIYPIPMAQTGTVSVIKVTAVSTDGLGTVTAIEVDEVGNYLTAPNGGSSANLVAAGTNYNGVGVYILAGLTAGLTYKYTPGINETGSFMNGADELTGEQVFVAAANVITLFGNDVDLTITATINQSAVNTPAYLRHIDPCANERFWGFNWQSCQKGAGLSLAVFYDTSPYSDENGSTINMFQVDGTPTIVSGGLNYRVGDLMVLTTGSSVVPAKIREAALILICHSLYQRRLAPDEKNIFAKLAEMWREKLTSIGNGGDEQLDGTYKRSFSIGAVWGQRSVLFGANSL